MPSIHAMIVSLCPASSQIAAPLTAAAAPQHGLWSYQASAIPKTTRSEGLNLQTTLRAELGCRETPDKVRLMQEFIVMRTEDNVSLEAALANLELYKVILGGYALGAPPSRGIYQTEHISPVCLSQIARQKNGTAMLRNVGWTCQRDHRAYDRLNGLPAEDFIHPFVLHPHLTLDRHAELKAIAAFSAHFHDWVSVLLPDLTPGTILVAPPYDESKI